MQGVLRDGGVITMKRLMTLLALLSLLPVWAKGAYAQVSIVFTSTASGAQFGSGGAGTTFASGNGTVGGYYCGWCEPGYPFNTPGALLQPSFLQITYESTSGAIPCSPEPVGCTISPDQITLQRTVTFPTTGQDSFIVTVPAAESGVSGSGASGSFFLGGAEGELTLDFFLIPGLEPPLYALVRGTFTSGNAAPEPGPLGLMAAGLAGLAFMGRRRRFRATLLTAG